jgi:hypothetical protein
MHAREYIMDGRDELRGCEALEHEVGGAAPDGV